MTGEPLPRDAGPEFLMSMKLFVATEPSVVLCWTSILAGGGWLSVGTRAISELAAHEARYGTPRPILFTRSM